MQRSRKTIRKGKRQKAWQYMRRNPMFSIKDILIILEMSEKSLMLLVRQLSKGGYLKQMKGGKVFKERTYKLIKNTGIVCPTWADKQSKLYDANIDAFGVKESTYTPKESKKIEQRPVSPEDYAKGRITRILESESEGLDLLTLSDRSGVPAGRFAFYMTSLQMDGKVEEIDKVGGVPIFKLVCNNEK